MLFTGMIYQFNGAQGTGLIMLSDGQTKEFSTDSWVDASNEPAVGLQVLYEDNADLIKIKVLSEEEKTSILNEQKPKQEEGVASFASIEEFQTHYSDKGFDVIKNSDETVVDELAMGKFSDAGVQIVTMRFNDFKIELTEKTVTLTNVDDHINYFKDIGFRLINDFEDNVSRKIILRKYVMDKHGEVRITYSDSKVSVSQTINGKEVG